MVFLEAELTIPTWLKRNAFRAVLKVAHHALGVYWHEKILPRHFVESAIKAYGYKPRTRKYNLRKLRTKGHQKPLVLSGELQNLVLRPGSRTVSSTSKSVTIRLRGSGHANYTRRHEELTAVNRTDQRKLEGFLINHVSASIGAWSKTETYRAA